MPPNTSTPNGVVLEAGGSYKVSQFAVDAEREVERLNAQVDLFWRQELAWYQRIGLGAGMRVLDCGCGPGHLLKQLLAACPSLECTGLELDPQLVALAQQAMAGNTQCRILQGSITAMELPDDTFDFVIARLVLEHLENPLAALAEIHRVLKPAGRALVVDNDFDFHERTWPDSPALDELYHAYCAARRSDGGNPCIGRQLPGMLKRAGFAAVNLELLAAHSDIVGDAAFSRAEGSGIPAQLVRTGHLSPAALNRIAEQWGGALATPGHAIFRFLFAVSGEKPRPGSALNSVPEPAADSPLVSAPESGWTDLRSPDEISRFIQRAIADDMRVPVESIASGVPLVSLGVDSIVAMTVCNKLQNCVSVTLNIADVLCANSVEEIAGKVAALLKTSLQPRNRIESRSRREPAESGA